MLGSNMLISLVFQAINKTSGAFSQINGEFKRLDATVKAVSKRFEHLNNIGNKMMTAGAGMTIAGGGLAYSLGLTDAVAQSLDAEHALRSLGNVGELTKKQISEIYRRILDTSRGTNQATKDIIEGMNTLVASGLNSTVAVEFMPTIGKTATAETANINELAKTTFAVYDNLKVPVRELGKAMDVLTQSGKEGRFELRDMARYFPEITSQVSQLGIHGITGITQLSAALQVAMKGAGGPEEAARNFQNFIMKLTAPETSKNFQKFGVNVKAEMEKAGKAGLDPIEHMLNKIQQITGGDMFKVGELFADMQVKNFLVPMMQNMDEYRRIRDKTFNATGVVDKDFQAMMGTTKEQMKQLKINLATLAMPGVNQFFDRLNAVLTRLNGSSTGLKIVLGGVAALLGGGLLLSGLGFMFMGISNGIVAAQVLGTVLRSTAQYALILGYRLITSATSGKIFAAAQWAATGAVKAMAVAQRLLNLAFVSSPIGWIILGIMALVAAGYLLYRNWDKIKIAWGKLVAFITGSNLFQAGKNIIMTLWNGIQSVIDKPFEAMKSLVQKMRNLLPFSPAREGPFRDLHRVRIMETIAAGITPAPLVGSMQSALAKTRAVIAPAGAGFSVPRWAGAGKAGGSTVINYSPTVTISGQAAAAKDDFVAMLKQHKDEILRLVESARLRDARLAY